MKCASQSVNGLKKRAEFSGWLGEFDELISCDRANIRFKGQGTVARRCPTNFDALI